MSRMHMFKENKKTIDMSHLITITMIASVDTKEHEVNEVTEEATKYSMFYPYVDTTEHVTNNVIICFCSN